MYKRRRNTTLILFIGIALLMLMDPVCSQTHSFIDRINLSEALDVSLINDEVEIEKGQIISNVLVIVNTDSTSANFYVTLNYPPLWKSLHSGDRLYTLAGKDTLYVPLRIIPGNIMKGDTKYFINAYIEDDMHRQVSTRYFFASTPKVSSWELIANPASRIYLKNNENIADFDISLVNTGNETQDIMMTLATASSNVVLMDSAEKPIRDFKHDITLVPREDSVFKYKVKYIQGERNFKNIDIDNYNPGEIRKEQQFSVFFHSEEPRREKYSNMSQNAKLDFIKLTSNKLVNPYGSDVVPLSAYLRVSNLMEDIVFSSLHLRGQKFLDNGGYLIYNTSFYMSSLDNFYGRNYARNIPWYVGYFDETKNIQVGYVNGGAIGVQSSGKGIKGEIEFLPGHRAGAFYIKSPYLFQPYRLESYGLHHKMQTDNLKVLTQYSHSHHRYAALRTDVLSTAPKFKINNRHSVNFTAAVSNRYSYYDPDSTFNKYGYLVGAGYTSHLIENVWRLNLRGSYTSRGFGAYGFERINVNHRSKVTAAPNLDISFVNNLNHYRYDPTYYSYIPDYNKNYYFYNTINFHSQKYLRHVQPGLFYDIRSHWGYNFHSRGINMSFNRYDIARNLQASLISTFGLNRIVNEPDKKENFMFKLSSMIRYQNFSFTGFYNYGPMTPAMIHMRQVNNIIPQTIRTSIIHMYLFRNRHVSLQSRASYMYTNVYSHHSLNLSPEVFYFTNTGWRFSVNPTFTFYSSKVQINNYDLPDYITEREYEFNRYSNDNFMISLGVKKDFGIPIPGTFDDFSDISFVAFYDLDGNKVQDANEPGIENIVIQVGSWSIITNSSGEAILDNADPGRFSYNAFSLTDLRGWFPLINDTLLIFKDEKVYVPFVKGVKLTGSVFIEQEITNPLKDKKLDISGIKISAINGQSFHTLTGIDGSFSFYLPFGEYTITLDEGILNGRYYLVKNNYTLDLSKQIENMYITFHIVEKKRKIRVKKFNGNGHQEEEN